MKIVLNRVECGFSKFKFEYNRKCVFQNYFKLGINVTVTKFKIEKYS